MSDLWEPADDPKAWMEENRTHDVSHMVGAFLETVCPGCGVTVGAFVIDGPEQGVVGLRCPRDVCEHEWEETT